MADGPVVDTDVLLKASAYRLAAELVAVLEPAGPPMALGLAHLISGKQLAHKIGIRDRNGAGAELGRLLGMLGRLEPDCQEIATAADLAAAAQMRGLPLDVGEAQLAAIVMKRGLPLLVTGDKRAISALARLVEERPERSSLVRRIACFEQVMVTIARLAGEEEVRARVCAEPVVDGAMRLACSCESEAWAPAQFYEACGSCTGAIRNEADDLLIEELALA